jgi:hypothetical protein
MLKPQTKPVSSYLLSWTNFSLGDKIWAEFSTLEVAA